MKNTKTTEANESTSLLATASPRGDRVIVRRDQLKKETPGGIILPDSVEQRPMQVGTVITVGPGRLLEDGDRLKMDLQVGARVVFSSYAGNAIEDHYGVAKGEQAEYLIMREDDILAVL